MSGVHSDLGPELRALAQSILDKLDPAVRLAAARAQSAGGPGRCQQVWCPVCALAALVSGQQHPLLDVVAEHSVTLLALVKAMVDNLDYSDSGDEGDNRDGRDGGDDITGSGPPSPPDPPGPDSPPPDDPAPPGRYQPIPVSLDE